MNRYGRTAREHWARFLPTRYAAIEDPERFFRELGEQVEDQVSYLAAQLAGNDPPGESYLEKMGRLTGARQQAEETTLRELVLLPAESGTTPEDDEEAEPTTPSSIGEWRPIQEDPDDPFWMAQER